MKFFRSFYCPIRNRKVLVYYLLGIIYNKFITQYTDFPPISCCCKKKERELPIINNDTQISKIERELDQARANRLSQNKLTYDNW